MASIVENIAGDRALQLGNEEFVRKLGIGNNWNKLRLIMRLFINGSSTITSPRLQMGVCSGDQNTFASTDCTGYAGASLNPRSSGNMTYSAGLYIYGQAAITASALSVKKITNTVTETVFGSTNDGHLPGVALGTTALFNVDIVRLSASSYSVTKGHCTIGQGVLATDFYTLLRSGEDETIGNFASTYLTAATGSSTLTGLPAVMDTLSIYWNKSTPTIEISDISVIRFY